MDWTQGSLAAAGLSLKGSIARVAGNLTDVNIVGVVTGDAAFEVSRTLVSPSSPTLTDAVLIAGTITVDANKGRKLRIGVPGFGLEITGGTAKIASLTDGTNNWAGIDTNQLAGTLTIGGTLVTATLSGGIVQVNQASNGSPIDWTQSALATAGLSLTSTSPTRFAGRLVTLQIANVLSG